VLVHEGFVYYDQYQKARPWIFGASLIAFATSSYLWTTRGVLKRKRGYRVTEANILYPAVMVVSGAAAWVTRPDSLFPPAEPRLTATESPEGEAGFLTWVDAKAAALRHGDPYFADKAFKRLTSSRALAPTWKETPEIARTLIECGRPQ
jgi:hypothetical protein